MNQSENPWRDFVGSVALSGTAMLVAILRAYIVQWGLMAYFAISFPWWAIVGCGFIWLVLMKLGEIASEEPRSNRESFKSQLVVTILALFSWLIIWAFSPDAPLTLAAILP